MKRNKILQIVIIVAAAALYWFQLGDVPESTLSTDTAPAVTQKGEIDVAREAGRSDVIVQQGGRVIKILPDDTQGSRHQKFIVRLHSGATVLVAHNIDLAPRVGGLKEGDWVVMKGEYEWNDKGGVVHWTHRDPNGSHPHGWLEVAGKRYE